MADETEGGSGADAAADEVKAAEPVGFTSHTRSLASEYAHEQGWGLNEDERTRLDAEPQAQDGGTDYDYGAQDFGDTAADTSAVQPSPAAVKFLTGSTPEEKTHVAEQSPSRPEEADNA